MQLLIAGASTQLDVDRLSLRKCSRCSSRDGRECNHVEFEFERNSSFVYHMHVQNVFVKLILSRSMGEPYAPQHAGDDSDGYLR